MCERNPVVKPERPWEHKSRGWFAAPFAGHGDPACNLATATSSCMVLAPLLRSGMSRTSLPCDRCGLGRPNFGHALVAWKRTKADKRHISWEQPSIFAARLGLTDEAARFAVLELGDCGRRFPTFWGPGRDWVPDRNWGGSGMIGLQGMLVQSHGRGIWLLPAWPKDWDVDFKLHAPYHTTIEDTVRDGELVRWRVTPEERRDDVTVVGPK